MYSGMDTLHMQQIWEWFKSAFKSDSPFTIAIHVCVNVYKLYYSKIYGSGPRVRIALPNNLLSLPLSILSVFF